MRHNGILVSIPNELVNTYLRGETNRRFSPYAFTSFWLGTNDLAVLNQWIWQDGLVWGFVKWQEGHPLPDDLVHNCGAMWLENGLWFSADCAEEKPFVCTVGFLPTEAPHIDPKPPAEEVKPTEPVAPPPPPENPPEVPADPPQLPPENPPPAA
uniref:C-type lectin domain-containing protein n=1 Tax=Panagrolaimus sp. PS1159 TaxID=55785 RepID=A0AC35GWQ0_9BILA